MHFSTTSSLALLGAVAAALLPTKVDAAPERGIAWPYFETTPASAFLPGAKWVYNYERYTPTGGSYAGMEFVPMQRTSDDIASLSSYAAVKSASWILGFNEPDNPNADGSNLSPAQAASLWKQYIQPLRTSTRKLVAPAVTSSSNAGQGYSWLKAFIAACNGCTFDAYAFHPYAQDAAAVQGSIDYMLGQGIKPLWVTEFNVDSAHLANGGSGFVTSMINYFNGKSTSDVARYSMIARVNKASSVAGQDLQNADGSLTAEGTTYKNS